MLIALAALAASTTSEMAFVERRGRWDVYRIHDGMCLVGSKDSSGTILALAVDRSKPAQATFMLGNPSWTSLKQGQSFPVDFLGNGESFNTGKPVVGMVGGQPFVFAATQMWKVEKAVHHWGSLAARYDGNILTIRYDDGYGLAAYEAARTCAGMGNDPFAGSAR